MTLSVLSSLVQASDQVQGELFGASQRYISYDYDYIDDIQIGPVSFFWEVTVLPFEACLA